MAYFEYSAGYFVQAKSSFWPVTESNCPAKLKIIAYNYLGHACSKTAELDSDRNAKAGALKCAVSAYEAAAADPLSLDRKRASPLRSKHYLSNARHELGKTLPDGKILMQSLAGQREVKEGILDLKKGAVSEDLVQLESANNDLGARLSSRAITREIEKTAGLQPSNEPAVKGEQQAGNTSLLGPNFQPPANTPPKSMAPKGKPNR